MDNPPQPLFVEKRLLRKTSYNEALKRIDENYKRLRQVIPYNACVGPNSNTYLAQLLRLSIDDANLTRKPKGAVAWDFTGDTGYGGIYFTKYGEPTDKWQSYVDRLKKERAENMENLGQLNLWR